MPSARTEVAAAEVGGKIYVMGGYEKNSNLVEEYDPATDSWRGRAPLPKPLHHIGAAALGGKIFVLGGYISGVGPVDTVYEYDPAKDQNNQKNDADRARRSRCRHHRRENLRGRRGRQERPQHPCQRILRSGSRPLEHAR